MEARVRLYLLTHEGQGKAKDIARELDYEKSEVNSFFYRHLDLFYQDEDYYWHVRGTTSGKTAEDAVLSKLLNKKHAKTFTEEEFENLSDWDQGYHPNTVNNTTSYETPWGNIIECESSSEVHMLEYLFDHDLLLACGGQALCVPYVNAFGTVKPYYPDIVALTKDHHIAIIEVKNIRAMSNHAQIAPCGRGNTGFGGTLWTESIVLGMA